MEGTTQSPPLPWKTRVAITAAGFLTDLTRRPNGTVNRRLLNAVNIRSPPYPDPVFGFKSYDVTVDRTRNLWIRIYLPITQDSEPAHLPVIFFFHGGGFVYLSADSKNYDAVCRRFCKKIPAVMVSVNYRLAPEYRHPAQYNDGFDALKYIDENNKKDKILPDYADMSCCFLVGDSAGGNIAHHVAVRAAGHTFQQLKASHVIGLVAIQPFFGGEERTEAEKRLVKVPIVNISRTDWMWKAILPDSDRDHEAINVSGPRAVNISALPDFPATMVVVGGFDILQDWQRRYYEWLRRHDKEAVILEYPTMIHAFYVFSELLEAGYLIGEIRQFVHNHMSKTAKGIPYVSL